MPAPGFQSDKILFRNHVCHFPAHMLVVSLYSDFHDIESVYSCYSPFSQSLPVQLRCQQCPKTFSLPLYVALPHIIANAGIKVHRKTVQMFDFSCVFDMVHSVLSDLQFSTHILSRDPENIPPFFPDASNILNRYSAKSTGRSMSACAFAPLSI